jgi:hypothetical protein
MRSFWDTARYKYLSYIRNTVYKTWEPCLCFENWNDLSEDMMQWASGVGTLSYIIRIIFNEIAI